MVDLVNNNRVEAIYKNLFNPKVRSLLPPIFGIFYFIILTDPQHEKAKQVAANYYATLAKLKIKEKIVKLFPGEGSNKNHVLNYKIRPKDKPNPAKGKNTVNSIEIAKVGRLHEKGFSVDKIAIELGIAYNKARYRLKLYNDEKTKQTSTKITNRNLPEKPKG